MHKSLLLLALAGSAGAQAEDALWELGVGATALSFPHYTGSDQRTNWLLPFPYISYESERLSVDRNAAHGHLWRRGDWRLEISASGSLPVDSEDDEARAGMPDLDAMGEIGPSLIYSAWQDDGSSLNLELPVRSAWSTDLRSLDEHGWFVNPQARYKHEWAVKEGRQSLELVGGPVWATSAYHDYFYTVLPRYATADRPAYEADKGYGGWRASIGWTHRQGRLWYGAFLRWYDLNDAAFADSPLVRTDHSLVAGAAMAWIFKSSKDD
ncbi:MAG: MipA/OmpV family protein [Gammaproteobacteria bacterium]|nr:MipA/OmpV family protein [Gammaproteobacteria bacterium]